jgi:SpoU rRNA methylase family enzyme
MHDVLGQGQDSTKDFHVLTGKEIIVHDEINQAINVLRELRLVVDG